MDIRDNKVFQWSIIVVILMSSLTIGARTYDISLTFQSIIRVIDNAITVLFLMELVIRILAEQKIRHFFHYKNGWNWFDTIIVIGSLIPFEEGSYLLLGRLLRLFRVMRLISFVPQLKLLTTALLIALPRMGYVALMMFVIFYIYATLGSLLFERINPTLWGDLGKSLLTLFRISTFEDWTDVMYETMTVYRTSWIFYVSFIFLSAFTFLNMMIGIVINVLEEEHDKMKDDQPDRLRLEEKIDALTQDIQDLKSRLIN